MPETLFQATKIFEPRIHSFVSAADSLFDTLLAAPSSKAAFLWKVNTGRLSSIAVIGFSPLASLEEFGFQTPPKNCDVCELPSWEWAVDPDNVTWLDPQAHLVAQAWFIKFKRKPSLPERFWAADSEVGSIDRNFTDAAIVETQAILPPNLLFLQRRKI